MFSWDLCLDPVWATVVRAWVWQRGGSYFGVPVSNFLGWYLNVYILYQLFALYLRDRPNHADVLPTGYRRVPVVFYGISAAGNLLLLIPRPGLLQVTDPPGKVWQVSSITAACGLTTIFTMGAFTFLAWLRLRDQQLAASASALEHRTTRERAAK
jgi:Carotenoid biosynthesis protein